MQTRSTQSRKIGRNAMLCGAMRGCDEVVVDGVLLMIVLLLLLLV